MAAESDDTTRINQPIFDLRLLEASTEKGAIGKLGSFHLQQEIGCGGMGVVYKAWDESLRRIVAVKFIRQDRSLSINARERFIREARAAAAVSHPHIVVVHRIDDIKGTPYIVMEYVDGISLERFLAKGKRFSALELMQLILQITEGLQAAHDSGIIHRDIKPSNILVESGSGRCKISDFGLARIGTESSNESESGVVVGTPAYMSPEQINNDVIDGRSDLFSLGCLIHALVTGSSPFQGKSFADTATRILTTTPRPLSVENPSVPVVLSAICSKLLEKNPADRYQSAKQLGNEIREVVYSLQRGIDVPMADTIVVEPPSRKRRQRWRNMAYAAGILCVLASVIAFFSFGNPRGLSPVQGQLSLVELGAAGRTITVSQSESSAEYRSLESALAAARSGDTIRVVDDAEYAVDLEIKGKRNLSLRATNRALLRQSNAAQPTLRITGSEGIAIEGFRIWCDDHNAILVTESSGVRLVDLQVVGKPRETAVLQINSCNGSSTAAPFVIERCRVESQGTGQCVWVQATQPAIQNLSIKSNVFLAQGISTAMVLAMKGGQVQLERNVFDGGHVGINIELQPVDPGTKRPELKIDHNTFHGLRSWIGFLSSDLAATPIVLRNNLILASPGVEASPAQQAAVAQFCSPEGNLWERSANKSEFETDELLKWARVEPEVIVRSRERNVDGFLILPADSPLRFNGNREALEPPGAFP